MNAKEAKELTCKNICSGREISPDIEEAKIREEIIASARKGKTYITAYYISTITRTKLRCDGYKITYHWHSDISFSHYTISWM